MYKVIDTFDGFEDIIGTYDTFDEARAAAKEVREMEITIKGTEKEIADLVVLLQNQRVVRKPYSDEFTVGVLTDASSDTPDTSSKQS